MRLVFMGTPAAAVPTLERCLSDGHEVVAVWTQPDKPAGRGNRLASSPVKEFALQNNITVHQPAKIKTPEAAELFRSHNAEVAVVVAYGRILPVAFLQTPARGCLNVHFSLLPKYRGAAPVNWAIVAGERETGITTMQMDEGLDTGDILLQSATEIPANETAPELMNRLSVLGAELLSETLRSLNNITPQAQNHEAASFAPIMKREDGLVDWFLTAEQIVNRVRGFQPFPNAFSYFGEKKLVLWRAEARESSEPLIAGTILEARGENLVIACGGGTAIHLHEVQIEGKRRMPARDFLNGANLRVGEKFG